jgi:hypothetical protein
VSAALNARQACFSTGVGDLQDGGGGATEEDGLFAVELPHDGIRAEQAFV